MAQGPIAVNSGSVATNSKIGVSAAAVIKATPGRLYKIVVTAPGSGSGVLTVNDCATTAAAAAGNQVFSIGFAALSVGQVLTFDWPFLVGIVVSAVPGAGSPLFNISYA